MVKNPLTAVLFVITGLLTQFMSNTAAAALLCPIGLSIAESLGASHWLLCLCRVHDPCSDPAEHNDLRSWWFAVYGLCKSRYPIVHHRNDYGIGTDAYYLAILPKCLIYRGTTALVLLTFLLANKQKK